MLTLRAPFLVQARDHVATVFVLELFRLREVRMNPWRLSPNCAAPSLRRRRGCCRLQAARMVCSGIIADGGRTVSTFGWKGGGNICWCHMRRFWRDSTRRGRTLDRSGMHCQSHPQGPRRGPQSTEAKASLLIDMLVQETQHVWKRCKWGPNMRSIWMTT